MQIRRFRIGPLSVLFILLIAGGVFLAQGPAGGESIVATDKDTYYPGDTVRVTFTQSPGNSSDWICIVPEGSPDTDAGDYQYLPNGVSQGVLTFEVPPPGRYEVRAYYHYRRNGYVVFARSGFQVEAQRVAHAPPAKVVEQTRRAEIPASRSLAPVSVRSESTAVGSGRPDMPPAAGLPVKVCIFRFGVRNIEASGYGPTLANLLNGALREHPEITLLGLRELEEFLSLNDLQQNDDVENIANIGVRLGLNYVVAGNVEKRGSLIIINYKLVRVNERRTIFTHQSRISGEAALAGDIGKVGGLLWDAIRSGG